MRKDRAAHQRLLCSQYICIQIFLFAIVIVLPIFVPADLSQQAKSAAADDLTY
jgi:hypothetical protein